MCGFFTRLPRETSERLVNGGREVECLLEADGSGRHAGLSRAALHEQPSKRGLPDLPMWGYYQHLKDGPWFYFQIPTQRQTLEQS